MERLAKSPSGHLHGHTAAARVSQPSSSAMFVDHRPEAVAQRKLIDAIGNSPRMAAQRKHLISMFGETQVIQRETEFAEKVGQLNAELESLWSQGDHKKAILERVTRAD